VECNSKASRPFLRLLNNLKFERATVLLFNDRVVEVEDLTVVPRVEEDLENAEILVPRESFQTIIPVTR